MTVEYTYIVYFVFHKDDGAQWRLFENNHLDYYCTKHIFVYICIALHNLSCKFIN